MASASVDASALPATLTRPVVLVGLMGAGKTTVGRRLAHAVKLPFIDSDQEIVEAAGCSISDIFDLYGEPALRDLERRVLHRLLSGAPCVLATGGGAFMQDDIRALIHAHATSVWLKASLEVLLERVSRRDNRPLLKQGDKREILTRLIHERYPIYAEATLVVESDNGSHETVVERILAALGVGQGVGG